MGGVLHCVTLGLTVLVSTIFSVGLLAASLSLTLAGEKMNSRSSMEGTTWHATCRPSASARRECIATLAQQQPGSAYPVTLELRAIPGDGATGVLVLPFGFPPHSPVQLQIDRQPPMPALHVLACAPVAGCIVPMRLTSADVASMQAGTTLTVWISATTTTGISYTIPLLGFHAALHPSRLLAPHQQLAHRP